YLSFVFSRPPTPRDPPPFPTRRSSDLPRVAHERPEHLLDVGAPHVIQAVDAGHERAPVALEQDLLGGEDVDQAPLAGGREVAQRSEEHTSELQSLRHLVCRLLLEKKKT